MYHIITWDLRQNVIQMYMYIFVPVKMKIIYWSCPCVGLVRWLVGSLQIFLEVLFWMLSDVPHHYLRFETECHTDVHVHICSCQMKIIYWSCPCVGLVRWLVGSLQIFLEVLFWMLSDVPHHYLRFETECHTDVHVHICSCQNENYLLVMSMCGTGQMTCRKPANIFRSTILDAKWCTTSLLEIWDRMSYRCTCTYLFLSKWKLFIGHVHVWDWSDDL